MRILYLSSRLPYPPHRGDRLTGYHFLRTMSHRHQVTLASFVDGHEPAESRRELSGFCERIETVLLPRPVSWAQAWLGLLSRVPSQVSYYRSAAMHRLVGRLERETPFDLAFVQLFRMAPYAVGLDRPSKVLFLGDSLALNLRKSQVYSPWWRAPGVAWEAARVDRYEVESTRWFDESWVLSSEEARTLQRRGAERVVVVRHGVDEGLFEVEPGGLAREVAVFLGNLSVPHNIDAARFAALEVWPRVREVRPAAVLRLVGADAVRAVRELVGRPGVEVTGFVPDLRTMWRETGLLLAPLRYSTGIQNKVLEAMAAGVPVVSTPPVAEAIGAEDGVHLRTGTDAASLAEAVLATMEDVAGRARAAARAREHVRNHFTWDEGIRRLESLMTPEAK